MARAFSGHLTNPALWARIRGAHLPVTRDGRDFPHQLADLAGLSDGEARALEDEYRRFLYLAVVAEAPCANAPGLVHLAWAHHAELDGYGEDFCPYVLGCELAPIAGEPDTGVRHAYAREFGEPPSPLWA